MGLHCGKNSVHPTTAQTKSGRDSSRVSSKGMEEFKRQNFGEVSFSIRGDLNCNLHMTSSMIYPDNLRRVGLLKKKECYVVALTISVITPALKRDITLTELEFNWGKLSLVRQVPKQIIAIIMQGTTHIFALLQPDSPRTSEITMTALCENKRVTVVTHISEEDLATRDDIYAFKYALHQEKKSSKVKKQSKRSTSNMINYESSLDGSSLFRTSLGPTQLLTTTNNVEEIVNVVEESYLREYGIKKNKRKTGLNMSKTEDRDNKRHDGTKEKNNSINDGVAEKITVQSTEEIIVHRTNSGATVFTSNSPSISSKNGTSISSERSRRSGMSSFSYEDYLGHRKKSSIESNIVNSCNSSFDSAHFSENLKINDTLINRNISTPNMNEENGLNYERPLCPTPNSRSDFSYLRTLRTSQTSETSVSLDGTKQRRPTPVASHIVPRDKKNREIKRRLSPFSKKLKRTYSSEQFSLREFPLIEESECNILSDHSRSDLNDQTHVCETHINKSRPEYVEDSLKEIRQQKKASSAKRSSSFDNINNYTDDDDVFVEENKKKIYQFGDIMEDDYFSALRMIAEMKTYNHMERERKDRLSSCLQPSETTVCKRTIQRTKSMPVIQLASRRKKSNQS